MLNKFKCDCKIFELVYLCKDFWTKKDSKIAKTASSIIINKNYITFFIHATILNDEDRSDLRCSTSNKVVDELNTINDDLYCEHNELFLTREQASDIFELCMTRSFLSVIAYMKKLGFIFNEK